MRASLVTSLALVAGFLVIDGIALAVLESAAVQTATADESTPLGLLLAACGVAAFAALGAMRFIHHRQNLSLAVAAVAACSGLALLLVA